MNILEALVAREEAEQLLRAPAAVPVILRAEDGVMAAISCFVGTPEWRLAWWEELALLQPLVAERLVMKFPNRYPVRRKPLEA